MTSSSRIGLVRCEFCQRQFNAHSAARHIPWCERQRHESKKHRLSAEQKEALERFKWRIAYKPSNRIRQQNCAAGSQPAARKPSSSSANSSRQSISSRSSSILSASTRTSGGATANQPIGRQPPPLPPRDQPPGPLQRSVSSHTLVVRQHKQPKQQQRHQSTKQHAATALPGAKSAYNLASGDVEELVELLARRMDQIYAQNKLLLTQIGLSKSSNFVCDPEANEPNGILSADAGGADDEQQQQRQQHRLECHHCKTAASCEQANYCHNCGCKLGRSANSIAGSLRSADGTVSCASSSPFD